MTEQGDEREAVEQAPANWHARWLAGAFPMGAPAVEEPDSADDNRGLKWQAEEGVSPSAMMLEGCDGAVDRPEAVEIRRFGSKRHGDSCVGGLAGEPRASEAGSSHQVSYGIHARAS